MSDRPVLTVVVPTYNRSGLRERAVRSALGQTAAGVEVVVVDDGSDEPVRLDGFPGVRLVRLPENRGVAAARNAGAEAARGRFVTFLDDDDELLPHFAERALDAIRRSTLPPPVAAVSGLENVGAGGAVRHRHRPPTLARGAHFFLEEAPPGTSFLSKQSLVVERDVLLGLGGYDEAVSGREHTDLFLRLNPVCSIEGVRAVGYRRSLHEGPRVSTTPGLRQRNFDRLVAKHRAVLEAHPRGFARFLYDHAYTSSQIGQWGPALRALAWAARLDPAYTAGRAGRQGLRVARGLARGVPPGGR